MSHSWRDERLEDLLADRALGELTAGMERELHARASCVLGGPADRESFELAAAAAHLAFVGDDLEPLPPALRARLNKALSEAIA